MRILINTCYGGFSLSEAVFKRIKVPWDGYGFLSNSDFYTKWIPENPHAYRARAQIVKAVLSIGLIESAGPYARLGIHKVEDYQKWRIVNDKGIEKVEIIGIIE